MMGKDYFLWNWCPQSPVVFENLYDIVTETWNSFLKHYYLVSKTNKNMQPIENFK
jgi:hypothetical protein